METASTKMLPNTININATQRIKYIFLYSQVSLFSNEKLLEDIISKVIYKVII